METDNETTPDVDVDGQEIAPPLGMHPEMASTLLQNQIQDPKSSVGIFDLPCGYLDPEGTLHREMKVREITGHEEDMLANPKIRSQAKINSLIASCVERVGTITDKGQLAGVIKDMTVGDRLFAIFAIRRVTVGDSYTYEAKCPSCGFRTTYTVDLSTLEIKEMDDPYKREFDVVLPRSKKKVKFVPMTGRGEIKLSQLDRKKTDSLSLSLLMRVTELDGVRPSMKTIKALSLPDRKYLRSQFDKHEGGVETEVDLDCPDCFHEFKEDVDVGQASFFFPSEVPES